MRALVRSKASRRALGEGSASLRLSRMASTASLAATSPVRCPPIPSATTKTPPQGVRA
jgi:hypothetical protein